MSSLISQNYARRAATSRRESGTGTERSHREARKNPIKALHQATCFVENALTFGAGGISKTFGFCGTDNPREAMM
jgi:hypothetical protein